MSAIPITPDDDLVRNSAIRGIPLPQDPQAPAIQLPQGQMPQLPQPSAPMATSNNGIPVRPQTKNGAIPIDPVSGDPEPLNNKGIPIRAGVAGLWAKADNIHNPVLRVLGKIGAGAARAIDTAGEVLTPGLESKIPGSEGNERVQLARKNEQESIAAKQDLESAQTANLKSETDARDNPQGKVGSTPEEVTIHDLMTGENGQPRVNPDTGKPYSYLEAYGATKQAAADTKTPPADKSAHITYDSGIPVSVVDPKGKVYDVNDPKLPPDLKPLVDAANRAHGQHVKEDSDKQARSFAAANQRQDNTANRQDVREHDKAYVQPAEAVEKSYQMMDHAFQEYEAARKAGKDLPTGAQSMLALSTHLSTTFGNVKGARVTKDMIREHLGARSISDDALVAVQKLTNGDQLSPEQWKAFHDLISESRKLTWDTATKQAKRKGIPVDFLPEDLQGGGNAAPPAGAKVRDYSHL